MTPPRLLPAALAAAAIAAGGAAATAVAGSQPPPATPTAPAPTTPTSPTTPAAPPASFTFVGRGWGHGIGMSQYGARGRALAGWNERRILRAYFTGVRFAKSKRKSVRVLLSTSLQEARFWSPARWRLLGRRPGGRNVTPLRTGATYMLQARADGTLAVKRGARVVAVVAGPVRFQSRARNGWVAWGRSQPESARRYRGGIRAVPSGGRFDLVNVLSMEDYLRGVVPREMPASWGDDAPAALAAQAIAARSYALSTMTPTSTYDVYDDQRDQVYGGVDAEDPRTNRAVRRTRGTVLTYDGAVITAYFFSTSGGRTEDVQNVFSGSGPRPYLKSVPDPFDKLSPYHVWPDPPTFSARRLGELLRLGAPVTAVEIVRRGTSPRVVQARVRTATGRTATFSGWSLRGTLGLRDTWFSVRANPAGS
jgi:stage II sporulation protein D